MLEDLPLVIALVGLVLYTVLAGADFGAGFWQLVAGSGERGRDIRNHAHRANAPVWEANHVWLILVLTVLWTAYPVFFGSVFSTLAVPLFLAGLGIVFRGLCYALDSATNVPRERRVIETGFAFASILTPFMLGTVVGGVASGRVPVGNAQGDLLTSWANPTSVMSGALAVSLGAFLAAVYLAADAARFPAAGLDEAFRVRALISGVVTGALALVALVVVHGDAPDLFDGLTSGWGLACVIVSGVAGIVALGLVARWSFRTARLVSALAVAGLLGGWAAAQDPDLLPGLTVSQAAADDSTLIAVVVSIAVGAVVLFPSLGFLFRLSLSGLLDADRRGPALRQPTAPDARRPGWAARAAGVGLIVTFLLLNIADSGAAHAVGVAALVATALAAFTAVGPDVLAARESLVHGEAPPEGPRG